MSDVITSAGLSEQINLNQPFNRRKAALQEIRSKLRKSDATDDEWDEALDALIEIAKDTDGE